MNKGIILLALGYELYGSCALNLAMSIKAYDPKMPILLVHDDNSIAELTKEELSIFDVLKKADPADYLVNGKPQYQRMKLCVNKYSDFDQTLYIDVDTLWFPNKKISNLFMNLEDKEFWIGKNGSYNPVTRLRSNHHYTYWGEPKKIARHFKLRNPLIQTISGVFYFKKGEFSDKIFARALQVYNDPAAPSVKWANGKADEYCFNIALSEAGYEQPESHLVYFDKVNGDLTRRQISDNFWGIAIGGNRIATEVRLFYNDLVDMFAEAFGFTPRHCVDKNEFITERRRF